MNDKNCIENVNKGDKVYYVSGANIEYGEVIDKQYENTFTRSRAFCNVQNENTGYIALHITEVYSTKEDAVESLIDTLNYVLKTFEAEIDLYNEKIQKKQLHTAKLKKRIDELKKINIYER